MHSFNRVTHINLHDSRCSITNVPILLSINTSFVLISIFFFLSHFPHSTCKFRYKPIIVFAAFMGMLLFGLLSWTSKSMLTVVQASFGTFMACEIAYYTYIYAKVERSKYQLVTGHTRSAILSGRFTASVVSQLLVSFGLMNYEELNYISFGCKSIYTYKRYLTLIFLDGTVCDLFLPALVHP